MVIVLRINGDLRHAWNKGYPSKNCTYEYTGWHKLLYLPPCHQLLNFKYKRVLCKHRMIPWGKSKTPQRIPPPSLLPSNCKTQKMPNYRDIVMQRHTDSFILLRQKTSEKFLECVTVRITLYHSVYINSVFGIIFTDLNVFWQFTKRSLQN